MRRTTSDSLVPARSTPSLRLKRIPFDPAAVRRDADHRPWPPPSRPWVMTQRWLDLLFAHWPVPPAVLRPHVPAALALDVHDGSAWIGIVPFRMRCVRRRGWPALPGTAAFAELNVRTYVTHEGRPGVWFFSLDAGSALAVAVARRWYHLPYFRAQFAVARRGDQVDYASCRCGSGGDAAVLRARYGPTAPPRRVLPGSLEYFLTERYCLFAVDGRGQVYCGEILHAPWPLQPAEAEIEENTMLAPLGLRLPAHSPLLHFSARLDVLVWGLQRC